MVGPRQARMSTPLPSPGIIDRPRLLSLIDRRPVVVLAGMAGYGKSTLLAAAARRQSDRGAALWLTVDESDREPVRLVSDLLTAASLSGLDELAAGLEPLAGIGAAGGAAHPRRLASRAALRHRCAADPGPRRPPAPRRVEGLGARHRPRAPVGTRQHAHRDRGTGRASAAAAASSAGGPSRVHRARRARVQSRTSRPRPSGPPVFASTPTPSTRSTRVTDGWPAGVRMAILAARQSGRPRQVPMELRRDQALADYLATEVLASLSDDLRGFVLDSCLDEQVCPSLIDTIRGTHGAEAYLEQCLADGLFLTRGDVSSEEAWYHWHPLFAAHIRRRLATDLPERAVALHAAAAAWWAPVDPPTAIRHAMAAGDEEMASRIFADRWLRPLPRGTRRRGARRGGAAPGGRCLLQRGAPREGPDPRTAGQP